MKKKSDRNRNDGLGWTKAKYTSDGSMTQARKKDIFGDGAVEMDKLSRGIVEDDDDKENVFADKWKAFATGEDIGMDDYDNLLDFNQDQFEELRSRFLKIRGSNDKFLEELGYLLEPLVNNDIDEVDQSKIMKQCNARGYYSFSYFLRQLNIINQSQKGSLNKK